MIVMSNIQEKSRKKVNFTSTEETKKNSFFDFIDVESYIVEEQIDGDDNVSACPSFYSFLLFGLEITNSLIP